MPITNVISIELTATELKQMDDALTVLETIFKNKAIQLTPAESQQYGKLGNKTENWSNMVSVSYIHLVKAILILSVSEVEKIILRCCGTALVIVNIFF